MFEFISSPLGTIPIAAGLPPSEAAPAAADGICEASQAILADELPRPPPPQK